MLNNLQNLNIAQRRFIFVLIFGGGILLLVGLTWLLANQALNTTRDLAVPVEVNVLVREFAALPDDDAYPPSVTVAQDGTVYTGSFASGTVWAITPAGEVSEIPNTRETIGALISITIASDGSLLVLDQLDTDPRSAGGKIWRIDLNDNTLTELAVGERWIALDDVTVDAQGRIYVSDAGSNQVWRFNGNGTAGAVWWVPPVNASDPRHAVRGLAYDTSTDSLIITDSELDIIYRVALADGATEQLYNHNGRDFAPGFDGITVTPDGTIYVAALGQKGIARVVNGELQYVAGLFRNPSDVDYAEPALLYVPNFDQSSLVLPFDVPQLPFAIDVIDLSMSSR